MWRRNLSNKFNSTITNRDGTTYRSRSEADYASLLALLKQGDEIRDYQHEPLFRLTVNGKHICNIYPDFLVVTKYGQEEIREVKGGFATQTPEWRIKWKLLQALHPEYKYQVVVKGKDF